MNSTGSTIVTQQLEAGESRRDVLRYLATLLAAGLAAPRNTFALPAAPLVTRKIPSSGEPLPVIGLGSWITFNVGDDRRARDECAAVIGAFLQAGGRLIDSSPMYGSSQAVIGHSLAKLGRPKVFSADKVWTSASTGAAQIEESRREWGVQRFDLLQVHNVLSWKSHLPALFRMKQSARLRYVGVTTSHGRRHEEIEAIMRRHPLDFVQVTYNPIDREVERRILPLARERGIAVIANRPFQQGALTRELVRHPLPAWARATGSRSWSQLILKFIISHPAITCVIPATSLAAHARENVEAGRGALLDAATRQRVVHYIGNL